MGFLRLDREIPLNLNKGTFSCFILITADVIAAVTTRDSGTRIDNGTSVMDKAIPFITWGGQQESVEYDWFTGSIGECLPFGFPPPLNVDSRYITGTHAVPVQQSFIGVHFPDGGSGDWTPRLAIHIQGGNGAVCSNGWEEEAPTFGSRPECLSGCDPDDVDASYVGNVGQYAYLGNTKTSLQTNLGTVGDFSSITLQVGVWQHVLVSWQLNSEGGAAVLGFDNNTSTEIGPTGAYLGVASSSRLYVAINDVNKSGEALPANWPGWSELSDNPTTDYDPNACVSPIVYNVTDEEGAVGNGVPCGDFEFNYQPEVSLNWGKIPTNPIWIPGPPTCAIDDDRGSLLIPNKGMIQSHLQLFAGVVVDTAVESKRRLFITSEGTPADPKAAASALGRKPAIQLIKSKDWIAGKNKGSAGDLTPNGTVEKYTPGPGG